MAKIMIMTGHAFMVGVRCKERAIVWGAFDCRRAGGTVAKHDSTVQKRNTIADGGSEFCMPGMARKLLCVSCMRIASPISFILFSFLMLPSLGAAVNRSAPAASVNLTGLSERWVAAAQAGEPDLLAVERAAMEHAQLADDPSRDWRKKARQSAALPTLSLSVDTGYLNRANFNVQDSISVTSSGVAIGPDANTINQYATNQTMFTAKAVWSLPDTLFHRQTLAIEQQVRSRFSDRAKVSERISALYFERLHLKSILMATRRHPARYPMDRVALMTALQKVTGELNLMTGGWFGTQLKGGAS